MVAESIMRKSQFTKHLDALNEDELRKELMMLFSKVPEVKQFYAMELGSDKERKSLYDRAKKDIAAKYATRSIRKPRRPRIQKINGILSDMKKAAIFQHEMADLYLFDVETALVFSLQHHFFSRVLANHITSTFEKAVEIIREHQLHELFFDRCSQIKERTIFIPEIYSDMKRIFNKIV